jgi:hypothetical protein
MNTLARWKTANLLLGIATLIVAAPSNGASSSGNEAKLALVAVLTAVFPRGASPSLPAPHLPDKGN